MRKTIKRVLIAGTSCLLLVLLAILFLNSGKGVTSFLVKTNAAYLERIVSGEIEGSWVWYVYEVRRDDDGCVFFAGTSGGRDCERWYSGFYWSFNGEPHSHMLVEHTTEPDGKGWVFRDTDGDWEYQERILNNWFWYEKHY